VSSGAPWDDPAEDQTPPEHEAPQADTAPAEPDYAGTEPGEDPAGELECPECGKRFKRAMHRGLHRRKAHGILGSAKKDRAPSRGGARRSRSSSPASDLGGSQPGSTGGESRRRKAIKDTLFELADLADSVMGRRGLAIDTTLPEIVRRDADRQAAAIAGLASRFEPLGVLIDVVFGAGGPLSFLLAFGPTLRKLRQLATQRQAERDQAAWEQLQEVPAEGITYPAAPDWTQG
jgi:hypothetical protein